MKKKELQGLFDVLQGEDSKKQVLLVGGCVRNTLMGCEVEDIDLASTHKPEVVQ